MGCDDELKDALGMIIRGERNVSSLEKADLLINATYYSEILKPGSDHTFDRLKWHKNSLEILSGSDIIFCDPDNGLIVKSVSEKSKKSDKYILPEEITPYFLSGKSVVFYNHRCREKEDIYLKRFQALRQRDELSDAVWKGLKFTRGTTRDYFFILQQEHVNRINIAIDYMMKTNWKKHFSILHI